MVVLKTLTGSRIYNLWTDDSDWDYRSIQLSPVRDIISPFKDPNTTSKINEDTDDVTWELRHFVKHAVKGNPSILEVLYSPEKFISTKHPIAKCLLKSKHKLLDNRAIYDAHRGYATAQIKKLATAERVINGEQETEWTVDRNLRRRKAIVAYFRILKQGSDLLKTGDFNTELEGDFRELLFGIKIGSIELDKEEFASLQDYWEATLKSSFEAAPNREVDYSWIEEFLERSYIDYASTGGLVSNLRYWYWNELH